MKKKDITKRLRIWAIIVASILMIPLLSKAPWTGSDYIFAGIALYGAASVYELTTKNMKDNNHRIIVGLTAFTIVIFIWALAVA